MTQTEINRRYQSVTKRSFERHMDLFLTAYFLRSADHNLLQVTPATYESFQPTQEELISYLESHQAKNSSIAFATASTVQELDDFINKWWGNYGDIEATYFKIHKQFHCISQDDFQALFSAQTELACKYCGITENQFKTLIDAGQIQTKRLRNRGTTFEIDCREPSLGYTKDNLAICCYWCNNAKTDEFTEKEFKPVAKALGLIWQQRLSALSAT